MAGLREALTEGAAYGVARYLLTGAATTTEVVVVAVIALGLPALYGVYAYRRNRK